MLPRACTCRGSAAGYLRTDAACQSAIGVGSYSPMRNGEMPKGGRWQHDASSRAAAAGPRPRGRADAGLSIVVPLFNEAGGLAALHERIVEVARRLKATRAGLRPRSSMSTTAAATTRSRSRAACRPTRSTSRSSRCRAISARRRRCSPASITPASAPCCSWTATASIRRRWSRRWSAIGSMTATTWSTPPRRIARTSRWLRRLGVKAFYALINWGARQKIPEDAGDFRLLSPRAAAALQAAAGAQPLLQGARELDRLPPDPRRLRAGRARARPHATGTCTR